MNVDELVTSVMQAFGLATNGKGKTDYKEIFILANKLSEAGIPFKIRELNGGYQIAYPNCEERVCSVVEHSFSYGAECDRLEIMGLLTKEEQEEDVGDEPAVKGYLTAEDVFGRISKHYAENNNKWQ